MIKYEFWTDGLKGKIGEYSIAIKYDYPNFRIDCTEEYNEQVCDARIEITSDDQTIFIVRPYCVQYQVGAHISAILAALSWVAEQLQYYSNDALLNSIEQLCSCPCFESPLGISAKYSLLVIEGK